jgi:hypothetical protein
VARGVQISMATKIILAAICFRDAVDLIAQSTVISKKLGFLRDFNNLGP